MARFLRTNDVSLSTVFLGVLATYAVREFFSENVARSLRRE